MRRSYPTSLFFCKQLDKPALIYNKVSNEELISHQVSGVRNMRIILSLLLKLILVEVVNLHLHDLRCMFYCPIFADITNMNVKVWREWGHIEKLKKV